MENDHGYQLLSRVRGPGHFPSIFQGRDGDGDGEIKTKEGGGSAAARGNRTRDLPRPKPNVLPQDHALSWDRPGFPCVEIDWDSCAIAACDVFGLSHCKTL